MPKVQEMVMTLLAELDIKDLPIPVEKIAQKLNIQLRFEPFENSHGQVSGMLFRDKGRTVIGINSNESSTRQRFTIAHELGHFKLHQEEMYLDTISDVFLRNEISRQAVSHKEIEANPFAAELLMPSGLVKEAYQKEKAVFAKRFEAAPFELIVDSLASTFNVSGQAMAYRLANLGIIKIPSNRHSSGN